MAEDAPTALLQESHIRGVSTRSVDARLETLGINKSQVVRLSGEIYERVVHVLLGRPIEVDRAYVWLSATCANVRRDSQTVSVAIIVDADVQRKAVTVEVTSATLPSPDTAAQKRFR